jgi:ParB family chromosome partitioning protein
VTRKKRLGRGLEALLNTTVESVDSVTAATQPITTTTTAAIAEPPAVRSPSVPVNVKQLDVVQSKDPTEGEIVHLNVYDIEDNPFQPRRVFSEAEIGSLAESLKEHDILQPILVRVVNGRYQLISGERRLRAAIKANWKTIPARLRTADDRLVSELAIVENLSVKI